MLRDGGGDGFGRRSERGVAARGDGRRLRRARVGDDASGFGGVAERLRGDGRAHSSREETPRFRRERGVERR